VTRKTTVGRVAKQQGYSAAFTTDCNTVWAGVLAKIARRIGLGLCGREKSGTLIPIKTRNNGIMRATKRIYRLCFANIFMGANYQIIIFKAICFISEISHSSGNNIPGQVLKT
jgi:hypothetical protein